MEHRGEIMEHFEQTALRRDPGELSSAGRQSGVPYAEATPVPARSELENRYEDERGMHAELIHKRRQGAPEDLSEIDRQVALLIGVIVGVKQRAAALAAVLTPVIKGGVVRPAEVNPSDPFEERATELGQRLDAAYRELQEIEVFLGAVAGHVAL